MNGIEQRLPFEEYKDRQLYLQFKEDFKEKTEQEIAEVLEDEVLDSGDDDKDEETLEK